MEVGGAAVSFLIAEGEGDHVFVIGVGGEEVFAEIFLWPGDAKPADA